MEKNAQIGRVMDPRLPQSAERPRRGASEEFGTRISGSEPILKFLIKRLQVETPRLHDPQDFVERPGAVLKHEAALSWKVSVKLRFGRQALVEVVDRLQEVDR